MGYYSRFINIDIQWDDDKVPELYELWNKLDENDSTGYISEFKYVVDMTPKVISHNPPVIDYQIDFHDDGFKHYNPEWIVVIARYIKEGFILVEGEEQGDVWKWVFKNNEVFKHIQTTVWSGELKKYNPAVNL